MLGGLEIGKLLGHNKVQATASYAHLANDPVKSTVNRIASRIAEVALDTRELGRSRGTRPPHPSRNPGRVQRVANGCHDRRLALPTATHT